MQIYTSDQGAKAILEEQYKFQIGTMLTPNASPGRKHHYDLPLAIDNGAFATWQKGCGFDEFYYLRLLHLIIEKNLKYEILVTPDIVAGGLESLDFSMMWRQRLAGWQKQYLAVQDGMEPWDVSVVMEEKFQGIFIGGTNEWKWKTAKGWVDFAHDNELKCHIGRCGTLDKLLYAHEIGADSVDSTNFSRNGDYKSIEAYHAMKGQGLFMPLAVAP